MAMNQSAISTLISLLVVALVARRELRATTVVGGRLWIRPAIIVAVTALLVALAVLEAPDRLGSLVAWIAGGVVAGGITGVVLLRYTSISDADRPNAVVVRGSIATVVIWLVVLALRVAVRYLFGGSSLAAGIDASVATVAVVAAALAVRASAFHRAIAARAINTQPR